MTLGTEKQERTAAMGVADFARVVILFTLGVAVALIHEQVPTLVNVLWGPLTVIVYASLVIWMCRPSRQPMTDWERRLAMESRPSLPVWMWVAGPIIALVALWLVIGLWNAVVWPAAKFGALVLCPFQVWALLGGRGGFE